MGQLILPAGMETVRPNRKARLAAKARAEAQAHDLARLRGGANAARPAGLPAHLPPPEVKVGWNEENIVLVVCFGPNQVPLPFTPDQCDQLIAALGAAALQVRKLHEPVELSADQEELLREASGKVVGSFETASAPVTAGEGDLSYSVSTEDFGFPPVADAVTDCPTD